MERGRGHSTQLSLYREFVPVPERHAALGILGLHQHDQAVRGAVVVPRSLQHDFGCLTALTTEKRPGLDHHRQGWRARLAPDHTMSASIGSRTSRLSNPPIKSSCGSIQRHAVFVRQPAASEAGAAWGSLSGVSPKPLPGNSLQTLRPWQPGRLSALPHYTPPLFG